CRSLRCRRSRNWRTPDAGASGCCSGRIAAGLETAASSVCGACGHEWPSVCAWGPPSSSSVTFEIARARSRRGGAAARSFVQIAATPGTQSQAIFTTMRRHGNLQQQTVMHLRVEVDPTPVVESHVAVALELLFFVSGTRPGALREH